MSLSTPANPSTKSKLARPHKSKHRRRSRPLPLPTLRQVLHRLLSAFLLVLLTLLLYIPHLLISPFRLLHSLLPFLISLSTSPKSATTTTSPPSSPSSSSSSSADLTALSLSPRPRPHPRRIPVRRRAPHAVHLTVNEPLAATPRAPPPRATLLFIHGFPDSPAVWAGSVRALVAAGFRCIVAALPACRGQDVAADALPTPAQVATQLRASLSKLDVRSVVTVAHTTGGVFAAALARADEDASGAGSGSRLVERAVFVDGFGGNGADLASLLAAGAASRPAAAAVPSSSSSSSPSSSSSSAAAAASSADFLRSPAPSAAHEPSARSVGDGSSAAGCEDVGCAHWSARVYLTAMRAAFACMYWMGHPLGTLGLRLALLSARYDARPLAEVRASMAWPFAAVLRAELDGVRGAARRWWEAVVLQPRRGAEKGTADSMDGRGDEDRRCLQGTDRAWVLPVDVPTLFVYGRGKVVELHDARWEASVRESLGGRVESFGCDAWVMLRRGTELNALLRKWLDRTERYVR